MILSKEKLVQLMEFDHGYIAADGGMSLSLVRSQHPDKGGTYGDREPYNGYVLRTANNDNATLFRAQYELWLARHKVARLGHDIYFFQYIRSLSAGYYGLYHRNPGRSEDTNSFDEYLGITALAILFDLPGVAEDICKYGEAYGWIFDNTDPKSGDLRYWRQGIDVFTYKMASYNRTPTPYEFLWFVLGTLWGCFSQGTSNPLLNWTRLEALSYLKSHRLSFTAQYYLLGVHVMKGIAAVIFKLRGGIGKMTQTYFGPDHPVAILANS